MDISEVPSLYEQTDIVFQPTLLECFTAVYPEAMRMRRPIVTTDLEFAHGLCGDAALYYSATDPEAASERLIELISNTELRQQLVDNGIEELKKSGFFSNAEPMTVMSAPALKAFSISCILRKPPPVIIGSDTQSLTAEIISFLIGFSAPLPASR